MGAHEGHGSAIVLKTRPVIKLNLEVSSKYEILTEIRMNFSVTTCVSHYGFNVLNITGNGVFGGGDDDGGIVVLVVFRNYLAK